MPPALPTPTCWPGTPEARTSPAPRCSPNIRARAADVTAAVGRAPRAHRSRCPSASAPTACPGGVGWLPLLTGVALVDAVRATTGIEAGVSGPTTSWSEPASWPASWPRWPRPTRSSWSAWPNVTLTAAEAPGSARHLTADAGRRGLDRDALGHAIPDRLGARIERWQCTPARTRRWWLTHTHSLTVGKAGCGAAIKSSAPQSEADNPAAAHRHRHHDVVTVSAGDIPPGAGELTQQRAGHHDPLESG